MEENEQKDTVISYLANQLLAEVTFAQVFEMTKFQVFKQAEETYGNMSKSEIQTLASQVAEARAQSEAQEAQEQAEASSGEVVQGAEENVVV